MKKEYFKTVTEETLKNTKKRWYDGGKELKVGDKIIFGFNVNYANLYGKPPSKVYEDNISLSLECFVLNKDSGFLYQLYKYQKK